MEQWQRASLPSRRDKAPPNSCILFLPAAPAGRHKSQLATKLRVTPTRIVPSAPRRDAEWRTHRRSRRRQPGAAAAAGGWWVVVVGEQSCLIGVQHVQKWCNFVGRSCHTRRFALQRNKSGPGSAVSRAPANLAAVPGSSQRRDGECGGWWERRARYPKRPTRPPNRRSITFNTREGAIKSFPEHAWSRRGAARQLASLAS